MSVSTDAILIFGMQIEPMSEDADKIDDLLNEDEDGISGWEQFEKLAKKTGAEVVLHCCADDAMYIVGVHSMYANRGYPVVVNPEKLRRTAPQTKSDLRAIENLCQAIGIAFKMKKCKWWLCSNWS